MATVDVQVAANANDGNVWGATFALNGLASNTEYIGLYASIIGKAFFNFTGLSGLAGVIASSAYLSLYGHTNSGSSLLKIKAAKAANQAVPTSVAEFNAMPLTTAAVDWDGTVTPSAWNNSPDISAIIQELINAYGNSLTSILLVVIDDGSANNNYWRVLDYNGGASTAAKLHFVHVPALISQAVGGGAATMAGTLNRTTKLALSGVLISAGSLGRTIKLGVGAGLVGLAATLGRTIKLGVGSGAVGLAGVMGIVSGLVHKTVGGAAMAIAGVLTRQKHAPPYTLSVTAEDHLALTLTAEKHLNLTLTAEKHLKLESTSLGA